MVTFLDDRMPGDVWQARRNAQKLGSKADPYAELRPPHDGMSGPEWQAARNAQVNGAPVRLKELGLAEEIRDALARRRRASCRPRTSPSRATSHAKSPRGETARQTFKLSGNAAAQRPQGALIDRTNTLP